MNETPRTILRLANGKLRPHVRLEGRLLPVVSGAEGDNTDVIPDLDDLLTIEEVTIERTRVLDSIDDIIRTSQENGDDGTPRGITDAEAAELAALEARADACEDRLHAVQRSATLDGAVERNARRRRSMVPVPMVNILGAAPAAADRTLDQLLWASVEATPAGDVMRNGLFVPHTYGAINPVEQTIVRNLNGEAEPAPFLADFMPDHHAIIRSFQACVADMQIFGLMAGKFGAHTEGSTEGVWEFARSNPAFMSRYESILRAMDVDTSAEGTEWVPTGIGAAVHEKVRAIGKVAALFARINIPTSPWKWPLEGADATAYRVAEPTSDTATKVTASTTGTAAATFDAEILGGRILFSRTIEAESVIAIMPYVRNKLALAFAIAEEQAIVNGDTDGTHMDSDVAASTTDARTAWDGLRKRGKANATTAGGDAMLSAALLATNRAAMGKYGINPAELAHIVGVTSYHLLLKDSNLLTVDKMGPAAVILNGQVASVGGVPIIVSEAVREDCTNAAIYDGVTQTQTWALTVNRGEWAMGQREAMSLEVDDSIYREAYQRVLVGFLREDFQNINESSSADDTAIILNLDLDAD